MQVGWIYHDDFLRHDPGHAHPERPERLCAIVDALHREGLIRQLTAIPFRPAPAEALASVHEPAYVELVRIACQEGMTFLGSRETGICPESYEVARLAAGGVLAACDAVMAGDVRRVFCAVRPPGHHAERDQAMGFCLFNNVALAAEHLVRRYALQRIAIVDLDVHHGNGTQHLFEHRRDVLYVSIHEHPHAMFPGTGHETEAGVDQGHGFTLNVPLQPGGGDNDYRAALERQVLPALDCFAPQFLLLSTGFDAIRGHRLAHMNLEPESFHWITALLVESAERHCAGRLVSVLEGGYELESLAAGACAHVRALLPNEGI